MALKTRALVVCMVAASGVSLAGCDASASSTAGSSSRATASSTAATSSAAKPDVSGTGAATGAATMTPGMTMQDGSTMAPGSPGTAPSEAAKMICTSETQDNMITMLPDAPEPAPVSTWKGGTYTCTYRLPTGVIVLSVHESADASAAAAYTKGLRPGLTGAKDLVGLTDIAFGNADGVVVMQKDNDTLRVDLTRAGSGSDRVHTKRVDFAYEIAAVILGCWTGN